MKRTSTRRRACSPAGTCARSATSDDPNRKYEYIFRENQHDVDAKVFTFPIYQDGTTTIPARAATEQDGIDFINAIARHPETGPRLARKLYAFFVNETQAPPAGFVTRIANVYYGSGYDMRTVVRAILLSPEFHDEASHFARYSWPTEFVVRAIKETGWVGYSVDSALSPLINMGQQLFEPPDVNGWELGEGWFSTSGMLSRMNYARVADHQSARQSAQRRAAVREDAAERAVVRHGSPVADAVRDGAVQRAARVSARRHQLDRLRQRVAAEGGWADPSGARLVVLPDGLAGGRAL